MSARVRSIRRTRAFVLVLTTIVGASGAVAATIPLPPRTIAAIHAACPACGNGFVACGSPAVAWGRRFPRTATLGTPTRAYLPTFTMTGEDFRTLARTTPYDALLTTLRERFASARLVVLEDELTRARVLPKPNAVKVLFPPELHACVHATDRPWSCCTSDCKECCEKSLGSPTIELTWHDADETITFHYNHTIGISWLDRKSRDHHTRYACLTDEKGTLRQGLLGANTRD